MPVWLRWKISFETLCRIWKKARELQGFSPDKTRQDVAGARIDWSDYGNVDSQFGWEIDHRKPVAEGGTDDLGNLQPLQWQNNRSKGDDYPMWTSTVAYELGYNVHRKKTLITQ